MKNGSHMALVFCKECLGWPDAFLDKAGAAIVFRPGDQQTGDHLQFDDREDVSAAVEAWCYAEKLDYRLCYESEAGQFEAIILSGDDRIPSGRHDSGYYGTATEALLAGCVEACRHLRSRSGTLTKNVRLLTE